MANLTLRDIGRMLLKDLPPAEDTPEQKSIATELLKYANLAPTDKTQFQRRVPGWILLAMAEKSQPVRTCIDAVVRECTRSTQYYDRCWDFYPKDSKADIKEDMEAQPEVPEEKPTEITPKAPGGEVPEEFAQKQEPFPPKEPDKEKPDEEEPKEGAPKKSTTVISRTQYKDFEELLLTPDRRNRRSSNQIISAGLYDLLVFDDAFLSIAFENGDVEKGKPVALYNEESDGMEIRVDKKGNIGDDTWFCDMCEPEREYKGHDVPSHVCPKHKIPMRETAYVQIYANKVRARWSKDEMIHIHMFRAGGRGYGSPPLMSLFYAVSNLMAMDTYFSDSYALQRTPRGFVVFTGVDQASVTQSAIIAEESVAANPMSVPWFAIPEGKSVEFVQLMSSAKDMQSIDFYKIYTEMVYKTFHVTPIVAGTIESGKSGNNPSIQLDVMADFIRGYQRAFAEAINNSILPERFGVKDWYFGFTPVEEEEEAAEAATQLSWAQVAKAWQDARFDVALDEDGKPYPVGNTPKEPEPPSMFGLPPPPGFGPKGPETSQEQKPSAPQPEKQPMGLPFGEEAKGQPLSMKAKSADWYANLIKAAPKPPGNEDWVSGLRSTEIGFYRGLDARYKASVQDAIAEVKALKNPTEGQVKAILDRTLDSMKADLVRTAKESLEEAYDVSFSDAVEEMGLEMDMTGRDEAALRWMESTWSGVESVLPEFVDDQKEVFSQIVKDAYAKEAGISTADIVDEFKKVSTAETWKLARIVRSEITLISNNARASAWKQADKEGLFKYDWSNVDDSCDVCANIAAGNPWKYEELADESSGGDGQPFRPHPFCRCTVVRHVLEKGGKAKQPTKRPLQKYGTHEGACAAVDSRGDTPREACGGGPDETGPREAKPSTEDEGKEPTEHPNRVHDPKTGRYIKLPPKPVERPRDPATGRYLTQEKPTPSKPLKVKTKAIFHDLRPDASSHSRMDSFIERNKIGTDLPPVMEGKVEVFWAEQGSRQAAMRWSGGKEPTEGDWSNARRYGGFYNRSDGQITMTPGRLAQSNAEWSLDPASHNYKTWFDNPDIATEQFMDSSPLHTYYHEYGHSMDDKMLNWVEQGQTIRSDAEGAFKEQYDWFQQEYERAYDVGRKAGPSVDKWCRTPYFALGSHSQCYAMTDRGGVLGRVVSLLLHSAGAHEEVLARRFHAHEEGARWLGIAILSHQGQ